MLVDNDSDDESIVVAEMNSFQIIKQKNATVGKLRNTGAFAGSEKVLVFLDADVEITPLWCKSLKEFSQRVPSDQAIISGYTCQVPLESGLIEKAWFSAPRTPNSYINSGNLITTRKTFDSINGFDESLTTGEDWDFCYRAKIQGGLLRPEIDFLTYHHGFPKTVSSFFRRELWHGRGDFESLKSFTRSKPAIFSIFYTIATIFILYFIIISPFHGATFLIGPISLLVPGIIFACKKNRNIKYLAINMLLSTLYFFARTGSLFFVCKEKLFNCKSNKHWR